MVGELKESWLDSRQVCTRDPFLRRKAQKTLGPSQPPIKYIEELLPRGDAAKR
jgi:hypothetical protein